MKKDSNIKHGLKARATRENITSYGHPSSRFLFDYTYSKIGTQTEFDSGRSLFAIFLTEIFRCRQRNGVHII